MSSYMLSGCATLFYLNTLFFCSVTFAFTDRFYNDSISQRHCSRLSQPVRVSFPVSLIQFSMFTNYVLYSVQRGTGAHWPPFEWFKKFYFPMNRTAMLWSWPHPSTFLEVKNVWVYVFFFTARTFAALYLLSADRAMDLRKVTGSFGRIRKEVQNLQ
jgi:hypothetical protein